MKKQIIISLVILLSIGLVAALEGPPVHAFHGTVTYSDGTLIQENLSITAKLEEFEDSSVIKNGKYGYSEDTLIVESDGETINFYIDGINESIETFTFESGQVTELNLTTNLTNPNLDLNNTNDSSSSSNSKSSKSSGGGGGGPSGSSTENIIKLDYKTGSLEGIGSIKINESEKTNSGITGSVINFISSGKVAITFVSLIGILIVLMIIKRYKR